MPRSNQWKGAVALSTSIALVGAGCANEAQSGALIGAGAGALIGQLLGGDTKSTAIGAGVGALVGGLVGSVVMAERAKQLERDIARTGGTGEVAHIGESRGEDAEPYELVVASLSEKSGPVLFQPRQDRITAGMTRQLDPMVEFLKSNSDLNVAVVGHTDNTEPPHEQVDLSHRRADAVARYLLTRGVAPQRIVTRGAGSYAPLASNETVEGRARNRRVDLVFYHNSEQPPEIRVTYQPTAAPAFAAAGSSGAVTAGPTAASPSPSQSPSPASPSSARPARGPISAASPAPAVESEPEPDPEPLPQSAVRPAHELAQIYTGTEQGRAEARAQQAQAAEAESAPPVSSVRSASELLRH